MGFSWMTIDILGHLLELTGSSEFNLKSDLLSQRPLFLKHSTLRQSVTVASPEVHTDHAVVPVLMKF